MRMETPPDERVMSSTGDAPSEGAAQREIPTSPFVGTGPQGKAGTGTVIQHLRGILPRTPLTEASAKNKDPATVSLLEISVSPPAISCEAPPPDKDGPFRIAVLFDEARSPKPCAPSF
jgi:hypothetical protein